MHQQRKKARINICVAVLLAAVCILSLPAPGMAHVTNGYSWSVALPVAEKEAVTSTLLTGDGQEIVLGLLEDTRELAIPVYIPENVYWNISLTSDNLEDLEAEGIVDGAQTYLSLDGLDGEWFYQGGGAQNVSLRLENLFPDFYVEEVVTESEETGEESADETASIEAVTASVTMTLSYIELPAEEVQQQEETVTIQEESAVQESAQTEQELQETEETQEEQAAEVLQETEGTQETEELQEEETQEALTLETISATFHVLLREGETDAQVYGELVQYPTKYHPSVAIPLVNGALDAELSLRTSDFPAMTRYTMDGKTYLLYDGGTISLPANASIMLDISQTAWIPEESTTDEAGEQESVDTSNEENVSENVPAESEEQSLTLLVGGHEYALTYANAPVLNESEAPFIMTGTQMVLPMTYLWNGAAPVVSVEQMKNIGGELVWETMSAELWSAEDEGSLLKLLSVGGAAEAGTYRLTVSWIENEVILYSLQTVFYVRSGNIM